MNKEVVLVGLGAMGLGIANNIQQKWGKLKGFDLNATAIDKAKGLGIDAYASFAELGAETIDVAILMVVNSKQCHSVLFEADLCSKLKPGATVLMCSTVSQEDAEDLSKKLFERGVYFIDAPVSGGAVGAEKGTLSIFASGSEQALASCRDVIESFSSNLFVISDVVGKGSAVKTAHQLLAGVHIAAMGEAMALAKQMGIPLEMMYEVVKVSAGYSWLFDDRAPRVISNNYIPKSTVDIFVKDLTLVEETGKLEKFPLPLTSAAYQMFSSVSARGYGHLDDAAVVGYFPNFNLENMAKSLEK